MADQFNEILKWAMAMAVLLFIIMIFIYGPNTLLPKVKEAALSTLTFLHLYKPDTYAVPIHPTPALSNKFEEFCDILENIGNNPEPCFVRYTPFGDLGKFSIQLEPEGNNTFIQLRSPNTPGEYRTIGNLTPCIVAGKRNGVIVAQNFFNNYFGSSSADSPEYSDVITITLIGDENIEAELKDDEHTHISSTGDNFEDSGMLYVPENGRICFFSTNWFSNYDINGIENGYIARLPGYLEAGSIRECSKKVES